APPHCAKKHWPRTPCRKISRAAFALIKVIIGERIELVRAFDVPPTLPAGEQSVRYHALIKLTRRGVAALAATLVCAVAWSAAASCPASGTSSKAAITYCSCAAW